MQNLVPGNGMLPHTNVKYGPLALRLGYKQKFKKSLGRPLVRV